MARTARTPRTTNVVANLLNPLSVLCNVASDGTLDDIYPFDNNFSEIPLDTVIEPCEFYSVASDIVGADDGGLDFVARGNDEKLILQPIKCENYPEELTLCINRAIVQCEDNGVELFVNGHFNPVLRVRKKAGYSDAKEKYPNRLELALD